MKRLLPVLLFVIWGCTNSQPQVSQVFSQVNDVWNPDAKAWQQRFSVFALVSNSDGLDEINRVIIVNDESKLSWTLESASWTQVDRSGETWLGANNLKPPEEFVPTGAWRLLVMTRSGLKSETSFVIPPPAIGASQPSRPDVRLEVPADKNAAFRLVGMPTDIVIWALGAGGEFLGQKKTTDPRFTLASVAGQVDRIARLMIYSYDRSLGRGIEAGPFELK